MDRRSISSKTILHLFMSCTLWCVVHAQHPDGMILLKQGAVIGVRIIRIICIYLFFFSLFCLTQRHCLNRNTNTCYIFKSHHLYIPVENIPGNVKNGRLFVFRNSIRSTTYWQFAICREFTDQII